jgi:cell division protein ZapE
MEADEAIFHPFTPRQRYRSAVERGELLPDSAQAELVGRTQALYEALTQNSTRPRSILDGLRELIAERNRAPVKGLYIWGGVGRGKTLLVNYFHEALPFEGKLRIHFHAFMQYVHGELRSLNHQQNPLATVADGLARDTRVICFDEFHVSDIADAMILGGLLKELFERGITLVATSNIAPDELYKGGLQRARFIPAIELIKEHTHVLELGSILDYRLRALERVEIYHHPLDPQAEVGLSDAFEKLCPENVVELPAIEIAGRSLEALWAADGIAWFDFAALCETPRSAADYIEIARRFHTVLVARVPRLCDEKLDGALRFIHLIDALYERSVNLVISAEAAPAELYTGHRLRQRFARAASRLVEMQTRDYLARRHMP